MASTIKMRNTSPILVIICFVVFGVLLINLYNCNVNDTHAKRTSEIKTVKEDCMGSDKVEKHLAVSDSRPDMNRQMDAGLPIIKSLRKLGVSSNLKLENVAKMSSEERQLTIHSILDNTDTICKRKLRMGKAGDGGWEICDDYDVRLTNPCVIYSFGINNDFSFDDDTAQYYGCHIYSFDPSMKAATHNRSSHVHFYKIGLSEKTEVNSLKWKLYSFSDIRNLLGHDDTEIDVVKMDIERAEWGALRQMIDSGEVKKFKQLLIEYHVNDSSLFKLQLLQDLEKAGYKKFYVHKNDVCQYKVNNFPGFRSRCYEVHYVRRP